MSWVDWLESARDELADVWVLATPTERDTIAKIVEETIRELEDDPLDVGESRHDNFRVAARLPLGFWFRVSDDAAIVKIFHVFRVAKRGK